MAGRVIDKDRGWNQLRRELARTTQGTHITVGVQGEEGERIRDGGLSNAELASVHEFGSADGHIPERSFLRATIDEQAPEYRKLVKQLATRVIDRKLQVTQALELLGQRVVADIRKRISGRIDPPNTEQTIRRKGSSVPLISTNQMTNAITYEVKG